MCIPLKFRSPGCQDTQFWRTLFLNLGAYTLLPPRLRDRDLGLLTVGIVAVAPHLPAAWFWGLAPNWITSFLIFTDLQMTPLGLHNSMSHFPYQIPSYLSLSIPTSVHNLLVMFLWTFLTNTDSNALKQALLRVCKVSVCLVGWFCFFEFLSVTVLVVLELTL